MVLGRHSRRAAVEAPTSWAAGGERIWGRHPPSTTCIPAQLRRASRSSRVGGSAPRREQVIAAASMASSSSASSVGCVDRVQRRSGGRAEQAGVGAARPAAPPENVSPAPTVSITVTGTPGRRVRRPVERAGDHAVAAEGDRDDGGAAAEPVLQDLLRGEAGHQPVQVLGLTFTTSATASSSCTPGQHVGRLAHEQRAAVRVVADRGGVGGLGHQRAQRGVAGRRGQRERPGVQRDDRAVRARPSARRPSTASRRCPPSGSRSSARRPAPTMTMAMDVCSVAATTWSSCDAVAAEVVAEAAAEHVVGDAGEHPGGHAEPGEPDRDVRRAAARGGLEVSADGRRDEVDERLARDGDDAVDRIGVPMTAPLVGTAPRAPVGPIVSGRDAGRQSGRPHDRAAPDLADGWRARGLDGAARRRGRGGAAVAGGGARTWCGARGGRAQPARPERGRAARAAGRRSPWSVDPHPLTRAKIGQPVATAFLPAGVTANHTLPTPWPVVSPAALSPL